MSSQESVSKVWISIAAMGEWSTTPELSSKFDLSLEKVVPGWREDLIQRGWETDVFEKSLLKALRGIDQVIFGELSFSPYFDDFPEGRFPSRQLRWAKVTAKTLKKLSHSGAIALYYDGAAKTYTPEMFDQLDVNDHPTLFHLFVEIWRDESRVGTEGMSIFGLPEICIDGIDPESAAAQATVFSLAAQMVCDEFRVYNGQTFRASESFPWFKARWIESSEEALSYMRKKEETQETSDQSSNDEDVPPEFPCGLLLLSP